MKSTNARYVTVDELAAMNYDFEKCCFFPHKEEEVLEPQEILENYLSERREIKREIEDIWAEIKFKLSGI